jgi:predicted nuclease of predicted toxin-antitoxin system
MKLLFDQNLSFKLCRLLDDLFPGSSQARIAGLAGASDRAIWDHAEANGFTIVTHDSDFAEMAALRGAPPKVIWLRCGNQPTTVIEHLLRSQSGVMSVFLEDDSAACLEIYQD